LISELIGTTDPGRKQFIESKIIQTHFVLKISDILSALNQNSGSGKDLMLELVKNT